MANDKENLSGTERSDEIYTDFLEWKKHVSDDEIKQISKDSLLIRTEIAKALNCSRSGVYSARMKVAIDKFEDELRGDKVLPQQLESKPAVKPDKQNKQDKPKAYDSSGRQLAKANARITELEKENIELNAQLKRYGELGEMLGEEGIK